MAAQGVRSERPSINGEPSLKGSQPLRHPCRLGGPGSQLPAGNAGMSHCGREGEEISRKEMCPPERPAHLLCSKAA